MARQPRLFLAGHPQHIILRSKDDSSIFQEKPDYRVYLEQLRAYSEKYQVQVHAYVLMPNHIHLLMTANDDKAISKLMQLLGRYFVMYINKEYERSGSLWAGRYKSTLIDADSYLLTVMRYIESKPVRMGKVSHPAHYPWSSYHANALGKPTPLISPHENYLKLGDNLSDRQRRYALMFETPISESTVTKIKDSVDKAWVLGSKEFKKRIEQQTERRVEPAKRGGDRKSDAYRKRVRAQLLILALLILDSYF